MPQKTKVKVAPADFQSLGKKLQRLHSSLSSGEAHVFESLIGTLAPGANKLRQHGWFHIPRSWGVGHNVPTLVAGGSDGLTILVYKNGKVVVIGPEGPMPEGPWLTGLGAIIPISGGVAQG